MSQIYNKSKWVLLGASALILSACAGTGNVKTEVTGTAFNQTLYQGYSTLSRAEKAEADYSDARYFEGKAMRAASGEMVMADDPQSRDLKGNAKVNALLKKTKLEKYLIGRDSISTFPAVSAKAQVAFDCWLQEAEEGIQTADIAACEAEYDKQIARLEKLTKPATAPAAVAEKPAEMPAIPGPFSIYFGLDSSTIDASSAKTLDAILAAASQAKVTKLDVVGYADRSGDVQYNNALSQRRADTVVVELQKRGLNGATVSHWSEGEMRPQVETADGVVERLNRRVTITLSR